MGRSTSDDPPRGQRSLTGARVVTGIFATRAEALASIEALGSGDLAIDAIHVLPEAVRRVGDLGVRLSTRAAEGASLGALAGAAAGALVGALGAGGAVVVPALGVVIAGPVVAALAGGGAAGALGLVMGGIAGARRLQLQAEWLEDAMDEGGALVAVRCPGEWAPAVEEALTAGGALAVRRHS